MKIKGLLLGMGLCLGANGLAQTPALINYQGRLLNAAGEAISSNVHFQVVLYDAALAGTVLYKEALGWCPVQNGMYAFAFGTNAVQMAAALAQPQCWLELLANSNALAPRHRLLSVPYAYHADKLDGRDAAAFATGMPVYVESDPLWNAQKTQYATGTPLYGFTELDPVWAAQKAGYATGSPLYAYTEADPVWNVQKSNYATGTPLYAYSETDPVWNVEKSQYATGTPLYAFAEVDPIWAAQKSAYATGTPLYGFTEADPVWLAEKSAYLTTLSASNSFLSKTGGVVTAALTIGSNLVVQGRATLALPEQMAAPQSGALIFTNGALKVYNGAQWVNVNTFAE